MFFFLCAYTNTLIIISRYQKEPKLARARQIPEWEEYDSEIARLSRSLAAEGKIHSRMASADANVLAGATNAVSDEGAENKIQGSAEREELEGTILTAGDNDESAEIERIGDEL